MQHVKWVGVAAVVLCAVGSPLSADSPHDRQREIFPLAVGNTWTYTMRLTTQSRGEVSGLVSTVVVTGTEPLDGKEHFLTEYRTHDGFVLRREWLSHKVDQVVCTKRMLYRIAERGLVHGTQTLYQAGDLLEQEDYGTPEIMLELPLAPGRHWVSQGVYFHILGNERIEVPAGVFDCWKVKTFFEGEDSFLHKYYAEGVGLVKEETYRFGKDQDVLNPIVLELVEYQLK